MNTTQLDIELDILQAIIENGKIYTELALREAFGPNALAYELEK